MINFEIRDTPRLQNLIDFVKENKLLYYCVNGRTYLFTHDPSGKYFTEFMFGYTYTDEKGDNVNSTTSNTINLSEHFCLCSKYILTTDEYNRQTLIEFKKQAIIDTLKTLESI